MFVDVDLVVIDAFNLLGEFLEDGGDDPAWSAPGCPEVNDDGPATGDLRYCGTRGCNI
jgi:hypothetical protein